MARYKVFGYGEEDKFRDEHAYYDVTNYIMQPQKAAYVGGYHITCLACAGQEMEQVARHFHKDKGKRIRHSELSFSEEEGISPEQAAVLGSKIAAYYAPQYQILFAVHTNTDHIHIHFVMNQISYVDGTRYQGKRKDYHDFIKHMRRVTGLPIIPARM